MKTILVAFTRAHLETGQYADRDEFELYGTDPAGDLLLVRIPEADAMPLAITVSGEGTGYLKVPEDQVRDRLPLRRAVILRHGGAPTRKVVEAYLPGNYAVISEDLQQIVIGGHDSGGFTLEWTRDRLGSGLIGCQVQS